MNVFFLNRKFELVNLKWYEMKREKICFAAHSPLLYFKNQCFSSKSWIKNSDKNQHDFTSRKMIIEMNWLLIRQEMKICCCCCNWALDVSSMKADDGMIQRESKVSNQVDIYNWVPPIRAILLIEMLYKLSHLSKPMSWVRWNLKKGLHTNVFRFCRF